MASARITLLACCAAALAAASPAVAGTTPAGDFTFAFSSAEPGTPTGLEFRQLYKHPDDPEAKPSPVRRFLFAAPDGTVFDGSAVPACTATDEQFQQMGKGACPAESVVGTGFITIMTGVPGEKPFPADATVFNSGDGIIELFTEQRTGTFLAMERPQFRGKNAFEDTDIAPTPGGPPDGQSSAREAYLQFPLTRGPDGRSFITTPPECPADRRWTARFEWTNGDGNSYENQHQAACTASVAPAGPPPPPPATARPPQRVTSHLRVERCARRVCPGRRRIVAFGRAPDGASVAVAVRHRGRTVARGVARVRDRVYRFRIVPRRSGHFRAMVVVRTSGGELRASSDRLKVRVR